MMMMMIALTRSVMKVAFTYRSFVKLFYFFFYLRDLAAVDTHKSVDAHSLVNE